MCLSTAYRNCKSDDCVAMRYVSEISVDGNMITLTDVMGSRYDIEGKLKYIDLTGGIVIIETAD